MRIAVLDNYQDAARRLADWDSLPNTELTVFSDHVSDMERLVERLAPFDIVVVIRERTPLPRTLIERLPRLKLIVSAARRNASIDLAACREHCITVCGTLASGTPTVDLVWGLIFGLLRHIPAEDRALREGRWQTTVGRSVEGATLGVVGLGNLGSRVARIGLAFGMQVIAWSENLTDARAHEIGALRVAKDELFSRADIVTLHLILGDRTRGIVGRTELRRMKRDALLINTARGPLVDEAALIDALREKWIGGAGLDVYDVEPLPAGHPLVGLPNTLLTPHLGYVTEANYALYFTGAVEDIRAWMDGAPIRVMSG
jgi:phosphoglycerate dehydrogenase-like enzyme